MKIALLGIGTVGGGVYKLAEKADAIQIKKVLVRRDRHEIRDIAVYDFNEIISDSEIDTVVEVMGGEEPALTYVKAALMAKKNVVTANKLMLSLHYDELIGLARENGVHIAFSAAVGGGIPWLANLLRASRVDKVVSLGGIMNGTTNYILTAMQQQGEDFARSLSSAQRLGYAEADPSADIDGLDVKAKIALSCDIAFSCMADTSKIPALGIRHITADDISRFKDMGLTCRLIGIGERSEAGAAVYVEPLLFSADAPEAVINGTGNIISYKCASIGNQSFSGMGAGENPTSSAVMQDILDIGNGLSPFDMASCAGSFYPDASLAEHQYYLRMKDIPKELIHKDLHGACITKPMKVMHMHALVQERISNGENAFAAGLSMCC